MSELETVELPEPEMEVVPVVESSFEDRVNRLVEMQKTDSEVGMRMLAEMYIFVNEFERAQRTMMEMGGPAQMLKSMFGKGG